MEILMKEDVDGLGSFDPEEATDNSRLHKDDEQIEAESKTEKVDDCLIRSLWGSNRYNYIYLSSEGSSGGIIVMWKEGIVHMEDQLIGAFSVSIKFRNASDNFVWLFTSVYGASDSGYYNQFWQELRDIRILFDEPWLIGGDFNAILSEDERNIPGGAMRNIRSFRAFVNKYSLIDLPMAGGRFTWTNFQQQPFLIRLDNFILSHPEFLINLKIWWNSLIFTGKPIFIFAKKLQALKVFIKKWQKSTFVEREQAKQHHSSIAMNIARKANQRAKEKWFKEGELNSAYLHQLANFKYKCNTISCLSVDGALTYDKKHIATEAKNLYSSLFTENHKVRPGFVSL
ncbi:uncharacterized protein LOC113290825 [Papaver somniferum]|uniref:uncharacterized protein LOC113290825 n=1 Tax=Papaver somniferum TaxID=3469 RepID=UPI000E6F6405|nr:uncharacterized protein LOC113290825 [Papaver somniferum]